MPDVKATVAEVAAANDWNVRVSLIRKIPEAFGKAWHRNVYARIAEQVYVPNLAPDFAYVHWRDEYELASTEGAYAQAYDLTEGFTRTGVEILTAVIAAQPRTVQVFRLLLGLTIPEFAVATQIVAERYDLKALSSSRIKSLEADRPVGRLWLDAARW